MPPPYPMLADGPNTDTTTRSLKGQSLQKSNTEVKTQERCFAENVPQEEVAWGPQASRGAWPSTPHLPDCGPVAWRGVVQEDPEGPGQRGGAGGQPRRSQAGPRTVCPAHRTRQERGGVNARQRSLPDAVGETPSTRRLLSRVSASCTASPVPDTTRFRTHAHLRTLRSRTAHTCVRARLTHTRRRPQSAAQEPQAKLTTSSPRDRH